MSAAVEGLRDAIWYAELHRNDVGLDWLLRSGQAVVDMFDHGTQDSAGTWVLRDDRGSHPWEETGEYLQMVQPSVGALLADFLIAEPEHPHAQKIIAELDRLSARYSERIKAGEVDGRRE